MGRDARHAGRWLEHGTLSTDSWREPPGGTDERMTPDVALDCGWGRLIFGHTFADQSQVLQLLRVEEPGHRDICVYARDPHVLVHRAPDEVFVDPSFTYRLWLHRYMQAPLGEAPLSVRAVTSLADVQEINRIYASCGMMTADIEQVWQNQHGRTFTYLVATDDRTGEIVGTVTGVDHVRAFGDPERGASLWCLAVDRQASLPNVGEALVRALAERYRARGRAYIDLSVLHDNVRAIRLYEKLGFERVPVYCIKRKNPINERLFAAPPDDGYERLNPYARIIADEARRRGIVVEVLDPEWGELRLSHGGRRVVTRESLSELTSAVALSRCDDKQVTRRILAREGLRVPRGALARGDEQDEAFLRDVGRLVVKPVRGEQGRGITVGASTPAELREAVELARSFCPEVLLEELVEGQDLRIVVIGHRVVAAAVRVPARVFGTGRHTVRELIEAQSRRRAAATGGESRIPLDGGTVDTVREAGYDMDSVLAEGVELAVRRTANLHTGGTIHDCTARLHPHLRDVAEAASRALDVPVTGLDLLVPRVDGPDYVIIEANERPGLANHEPQPTAERFVDLLFPSTSAIPVRGRSADLRSHDHAPR
ncbi:N-acetylglutaminylglutamine synthetase [Motilibacter aurantiacus]|uniref:N-acetylglutaminylglutamine synthetase n=1 Tax=Motilibacter aurantiacus TaxID=2714955 RepID=UPI001409982C|nr:N-acetylglutaminylglutamine synthetase [Motilibacter aurantiacus]NHC46036.1 N-acetylglutaminylglutamine synthetase [Motilibacter aurantiacus]